MTDRTHALFRRTYGHKLRRALSEQRWLITIRGGHFRLVGPRGQAVFASATPSDRRVIKNLRAELARNGFRQGKCG